MSTSSKIISLYFFILMQLCAGCSYVQVKSPSQSAIDKTSNNSLILLRIAAEVNNKPIDISEPPIFRGYANPYTLILSDLVTGDAPEIIYPGSERANAPSEQMKKQGWIYFYTAPGDYELNVKTYRFNSELIPTIKNGQFKKRVIDKTGFQNLAGLKSHWLNAT